MDAPALRWSDDAYAAFGREARCDRHPLADTPFASDAALTALLDRFPRRRLGAFTMGDGPENLASWQPVEVGEVGGQALLDVVRRGRLWLNLIDADRESEEIARAVDGLFGDLGDHAPALRRLRRRSATLLVSSPGAQVFYHFDTDPNMLWHLRGHKRIWIYPPYDVAIADPAQVEDVCCGATLDEELPFRSEFDDVATSFALEPGEVASWPQHAPHRVVNGDDLNVSLATFYGTAASDRRLAIQAANRWLRQRGYDSPRVTDTGARAAAKAGLGRWLRTRAARSPLVRPTRLAKLAVDPDAPDGLRTLPSSIPTTYA